MTSDIFTLKWSLHVTSLASFTCALTWCVRVTTWPIHCQKYSMLEVKTMDEMKQEGLVCFLWVFREKEKWKRYRCTNGVVHLLFLKRCH